VKAADEVGRTPRDRPHFARREGMRIFVNARARLPETGRGSRASAHSVIPGLSVGHTTSPPPRFDMPFTPSIPFFVNTFVNTPVKKICTHGALFSEMRVQVVLHPWALYVSTLLYSVRCENKRFVGSASLFGGSVLHLSVLHVSSCVCTHRCVSLFCMSQVAYAPIAASPCSAGRVLRLSSFVFRSVSRGARPSRLRKRARLLI
jgi:hypothetical protein